MFQLYGPTRRQLWRTLVWWFTRCKAALHHWFQRSDRREFGATRRRIWCTLAWWFFRCKLATHRWWQSNRSSISATGPPQEYFWRALAWCSSYYWRSKAASHRWWQRRQNFNVRPFPLDDNAQRTFTVPSSLPLHDDNDPRPFTLRLLEQRLRQEEQQEQEQKEEENRRSTYQLCPSKGQQHQQVLRRSKRTKKPRHNEDYVFY